MSFRHWSQLNPFGAAVGAIQAFGQFAHLEVTAASKKKNRIKRSIGLAGRAMRQHAINHAGKFIQLHRKHS